MFSLYFYPRPPGGGRRCLPHRHPLLQKFLSTPSGWRATDVAIDNWHRARISIHALRVEGDQLLRRRLRLKIVDFYPRPPGGGRPFCKNTVADRRSFLSTPSGWRATKATGDAISAVKISIHALRVEGDILISTAIAFSRQFLSTPSGWRATRPTRTHRRTRRISIHALRVEGD